MTRLIHWIVLTAMAFAALATTSLATPVRAQTAMAASAETAAPTVERPNPPDFLQVYRGLLDEHAGVRDCVDDERKDALERYWARKVPLVAAAYDVSLAYRRCEGFNAFWATLYFSGYDSPEEWIEVEFRLIRTAAIERAGADVDQMTEALAILRAERSRLMKERGRRTPTERATIEEFTRLAYAVDALTPLPGDPEQFAQIIEHDRERLLAALPETAEQELLDALDAAGIELEDE